MDRVPQVMRSYLRIVALLPSAGRPLLIALLGVNVVLGAVPVVFVVATSVMIGRVPAAVAGGVGSAAWNELVVWFGLAAASFVVQQIAAPLQVSLGELLSRRVDGQVYDRLIAASLRTPGIAPLEDQRLLGDLTEAARALEFVFRTPGNACAAILALVARYGQLLAYAGIVGLVFSWPAAAALVVATMLFRTGNRGGLRTYGRIFTRNVAERRETTYLRAIAMEAPAAKEIRVFGLTDWLADRFRRSTMRWLMPVWAERRRVYVKPYLAYTGVGLAVAGVTFAALGQAAASGSLTLTQLTLALQAGLAALNLGQYFPEADTQTEFGMIAYDAVATYERAVTAYDDPVTGPAAARRADPHGLPRHGIRFESVGFHYPGSDRPVLDDLELSLPAGQCTAIVGLNGAGKTTLVKLLSRLYEPTSGRLTVDGVDVRSFAVDDWRRRIGVIFQDFNRYELSAAENIGWGSIELGRRSRADPRGRAPGRDPHGAGRPAARAGHAAVAPVPRRGGPVRRAMAAGRDRPRPVRPRERRRDPRPGRAHGGTRRPGRGRVLRSVRRAHAGRDLDPHLASLLERAQGRPDRGARGRAGRGDRDAPRAGRVRRPVRGAVPAPGRALPRGRGRPRARR